MRRAGFRRGPGPRDASAPPAPGSGSIANTPACTPALPPSSRRSHALANFQSCITVSGETFNTSAVSCTLSPPKKRSSTTWPLLGSIADRACKASSSATKSCPGSGDTMRASSNETAWASPPRLRERRERARSTRMRRINWAETPKKWARFCQFTSFTSTSRR